MKFNNQTAPNAWGGVCNLPTIGPVERHRACRSRLSVGRSPVDPVTVHADYTNVVTNETNESNSFGWGTAAVKPKAPINLVNFPPYCGLRLY